MNNHFEISRLGYLLRRNIILDWRSLAIAGGIVSGILFLIRFLETWFSRGAAHGNGTEYAVYLIFTLAIWGAIYASMTFRSLHDKNSNEAYLLLPASSLEKVTIEVLLTSLVLPLAIIVLITFASIVTEGVTGLLFQTGFEPLNPFRKEIFIAWGYTVIGQAVFILGSAWFRKAHFIKTVLALVVGAIGFGIVTGIFFRIVFASYFEGFFTPIDMHFDMEQLMVQNYPGLMNFMEYTGRIVFYYVLTPFCWFTAWLRVKETEVSDGV